MLLNLDPLFKELVQEKNSINSMYKVILGLVLLFFLSACVKESPRIPVSLEKAAEIIIDVHGSEAALQNVYGSRKDSLAGIYYQQIYTAHDIDSTTFQEMMNILRSDPEQLNEVYKLAMQRIELRENSEN